MLRFRNAALPTLFFVCTGSIFLHSQTNTQAAAEHSADPVLSSQASPEKGSAPAAIPANAARISKQTRYEIIRDFETQLVYARSAFPMGAKGLRLKDGALNPSGEELQQALALWGPAVKPGDPAQISYVQIKDDHIHFEINGGPVRRKKWYQHVTIAGAGGTGITPGGNQNQSSENPHGSFVDLYFDRYVTELTAQQVRDLLLPVLDFNAKSKEQAYLDTVPPKVKEAIVAHHVLVGMDPDMVIHAKGKPPKKVREKDGETEYEEWIYGDPPQDVDFVRISGGEVVRVETMKVGGEKVVRTEKEVILENPEKEAKQEQAERPPNAPSLRRPGEDSDAVPKPANGASPIPPIAPPDVPQPTGNPGPGEIVATGR